jgi:hypothetical protein
MRTAEDQTANERGTQAFTRAMHAATMHMADEEAIRHERRIQAYARAMRAERKGPFDQMGPLGHAIVWWVLEATPAMQRARAVLWRERMFLVATTAAALGAAKLLLG